MSWRDPRVAAKRSNDPVLRGSLPRYRRTMAKQPVLTPQGDDFPRWYQDVVAKAELAENGPVRGTMVVRPYGYAIWERMQAELDNRIKAAGAANVYFPMFIPEAYLRKEAEHVEGFSPELAVVTHAGGKELEEPAVVRPTSETIFNAYFPKWVQSYRDLPLLLNQWCNVVRWELRPRLFLRTTEFLWQEGHTCHATEDDARTYALRILRDVYEDVMVNILAVPVHVGRKTARERFAGANQSWTCEGMMRDGKALQMGTSHELGQNFARVFETTYLDDNGDQQFVWQTSWGVSTRLVGAVIMAHGDDNGLRLPPRLAPVQVVVVLVRAEDGAGEAAATLAAELRGRGVRVELDDRVDQSFGRRVVGWELKGVPVRLEVGPRDLAGGSVTVVRRDSGEKAAVPVGSAADAVVAALDAVQSGLLAEATELRDRRTAAAAGLDEAAEAARDGWAVLPWTVVGDEGEAKLAESGVSVRCLQTADGGLPARDATDLRALVARAY
jgi:prolyl-tRNA synthetase